MSVRFWQTIFVLLCVWDTLATQTIVSSNIADEWNPLMDSVIRLAGWKWVWATKMGLGLVFVWSIPKLWKHWWWKILVVIAFLWYSVVSVLHVFLLYCL